MRFFACDAWVDENCRIEHFVGAARSVLENKEIDFMAIERGEDNAICMERSLNSVCVDAQWNCVVIDVEMRMQVTMVSRERGSG